MDEGWNGVEKSLRQLLGLVKKNLGASEWREVEDFINGNEFDAAMEALVDFLVERRAPLSRQAFDLARKIAVTLELGGELERLREKLSPGKS